MAQIKCTLPNASTEISGVKFEPIGGAMLSEDVSDDVALGFASIPGYEVVGVNGETADGGDTAKAKPAKPAK